MEPLKRWTRAEYERLTELGVFTTDDRIELLNGVIVEKRPHTPRHAFTLMRITKFFALRFDEKLHYRPQLPLALGEYSMPEPDGAIITGEIRDYALSHPTTAALVLEAAEETLRLDRTEKMEIYAEAGIEDYWIVNINDRVLEVYREPAAISGTPSGYGYRSVRHYAETEQIAPLFAPQAQIEISTLLP